MSKSTFKDLISNIKDPTVKRFIEKIYLYHLENRKHRNYKYKDMYKSEIKNIGEGRLK
tara:strand:- start:905 stop:1078 length:174 start_codon:yes stop_codon:yes gene_type:complete